VGLDYVLVGAVVGAIASQIVYPALAPYVDMWAFAYIHRTPFAPTFLVIADEGQTTTGIEPGNLLTYSRMFGGGISICIQKLVEFDPNTRPSEWRFADEKNMRTKTVIIGNADERFIDQRIKEPGYLNLTELLPHSYAGHGFGCMLNEQTNVKTKGHYYAYVGDITRVLKGLDLAKMGLPDYLKSIDDHKHCSPGLSAAAIR
jgi:hypothetical protein